KAGKRVDGQYYVVSTDHLFFVDTGYATEFRGKRYTIKKGSSPVKNLARFAQAVQQAAQKAQQIAQNIQNAAAWALKAAREAATQVTDIATEAIQHAKDAYDAVKTAALDAVHTAGDQLSAAVQGLKSSLLASAEAAVSVGKAGMTLAQAAILKGKNAIEM